MFLIKMFNIVNLRPPDPMDPAERLTQECEMTHFNQETCLADACLSLDLHAWKLQDLQQQLKEILLTPKCSSKRR